MYHKYLLSREFLRLVFPLDQTVEFLGSFTFEDRVWRIIFQIQTRNRAGSQLVVGYSILCLSIAATNGVSFEVGR